MIKIIKPGKIMIAKCPKCECDACDSLFTIWWDGEKDDGPDYKVTYLGKALDLCPNCYSQITSFLERRKYVN